jgi:hypothetical protein
MGGHGGWARSSVSCSGFDEEYLEDSCVLALGRNGVSLSGSCNGGVAARSWRGPHLLRRGPAGTFGASWIHCTAPERFIPGRKHFPAPPWGHQTLILAQNPTRIRTRNRCGAASARRTRGHTRPGRSGQLKSFNDRACLLLQHAALVHKFLGGGFLLRKPGHVVRA